VLRIENPNVGGLIQYEDVVEVGARLWLSYYKHIYKGQLISTAIV